ncbi:EAL domain-containing protein [Thermosulfurimonas marina]|uniref:Diguanylate cyclase DosC n=1 Tax=Thermosulfurimonas marina TaxID=2047767 RepID=A0A6H1WS84_9BACT|nr:EAL domain-containing protein [Thermosulfurimonas marina]QJA06030.1 EAL domain-containing protein [Thermosulfurimonas marina]
MVSPLLLPTEEEKGLLEELAALAQERGLYEEFYRHVALLKDSPALEEIFSDPQRFAALKEKISSFLVDFLAAPSSAEILARTEAVARRHLEVGVSPARFQEGLFLLWHILYRELGAREKVPKRRGTLRILLTRLIFWLSLRVTGVYFVLREENLAEALKELETLNRIYALLREINLLIFEEREDVHRLLERACEIMVRVGGFALAWVALNRPPSPEVEIAAAAGETAYLEDFEVSADPERPSGQGPCGLSLREGRPVVVGDTRQDPRFRPWAEKSERLGFRSLVALPLSLEGELRGSLLLYARTPHHFTAREIRLLEEIARDLSLGYLHILKTRALEEALFRDVLTGLPNQRYLLAALEHELEIAGHKALPLILVRLDLDRFSALNLELGRVRADALLREIGARLLWLVSNSGTLARVGPDEFAFSYLLDDLSPGALVARVQKALSEPFRIDHEEIRLTASLGAALFPEDGREPEALLDAASLALKEARKKGPGGMAFYSPKVSEKALTHFVLLRDLERALERQEFVLYFQPRIALSSRKVTSLEALIRWQAPEKGLVPPGEFIPPLEDSGLIVEVGRWVIREAARALKELREEFPELRLSFNVSVKQFLDQEVLLSALREALSETGLPGQALEMEITESLLFKVGASGEGLLEEVAGMGLEIALDDFGTGYSSFAYLKKIPARTLKIDYSFVKGLPESREDAEVVMAIVSMARNLGKRLVAEGVERKEQLAFLAGLGVEEIQGFLFARPLPLEEVRLFLRTFDPSKAFW